MALLVVGLMWVARRKGQLTVPVPALAFAAILDFGGMFS
jgi:hypothetical protein